MAAGDDLSGSGSGMCAGGQCSRGRPGLYAYPFDNNRVRSAAATQRGLCGLLLLLPPAILLLQRWLTTIGPQNWGGTFKGTQVGCSGRPDWNLPLQKKKKLKTFWVNEQMFLQGAQKKQWKYDYLVALLFGCASLMWPFVELAFWGEDEGLKTIINKGLLTLSVPFSVERVERAKLNEICPQEATHSRRLFFF